MRALLATGIAVSLAALAGGAQMKPSAGEHVDLTAVVEHLPGEFLEARWA